MDNTIRAGSRGLRLLAAFGLPVLLLVSCPFGPLYAQVHPDPGHGFYGAVRTNGKDAAVGTAISARVGGVEYGSWTVTNAGRYALVVQGDIDEGATIYFYVADQQADQTHAFHDGLTTPLDLTAPAAPGDDDDDPHRSWWPRWLPNLTDCFIATAAYGTPTAPEIDVLREFRDAVLLESAAGSQFVALYYRLGPPAAEVIARSDLLRTLVRELVVHPLVQTVRATGHLWRS